MSRKSSLAPFIPPDWKSKLEIEPGPFTLPETISQRATRLVEQHFLAHHLQLADALIAATALTHQLELVTSNTKHFQPIAGLQLGPYGAA